MKRADLNGHSSVILTVLDRDLGERFCKCGQQIPTIRTEKDDQEAGRMRGSAEARQGRFCRERKERTDRSHRLAPKPY